MKTTEEIRHLLDRFYDGQTNEAEETILKQYFSSNDIAPELEVERIMFDCLITTNISKPNGLEHRLEQQINQWNRIELSTKRSQRVISLRWIVGVAAAITLLLTMGLGFYQQQMQQETLKYSEIIDKKQDTYQHPKDAYKTTHWALQKFANSINKGLKAAQLNTENKTD